MVTNLNPTGNLKGICTETKPDPSPNIYPNPSPTYPANPTKPYCLMVSHAHVNRKT